jgi:hypothetical protein
MNERTAGMRALLFLYSSGNILGCALALLGPLLLFAGVIGTGWLAITAGLYAAGWLLGRRSPVLERQIEASLSAEQTLERLDRLIASAKDHLTAEMLPHLASIRSSVAEVLPRLLTSEKHGNDLFTVRETVLRYLPETLANYAALPPAFRTRHPLKDGKTASVLMADQLTVLDEQLRQVVANVASSDAQALVANGQFLQAKFNQPDFLAR